MSLLELWQGLFWPLGRLLLTMSVGLLLAHFIESMNWTARVAMVARPLSRMGRLSDQAAVSFSMAFFSGIAANTMLAEAYEQGQISKRELVCANLYNSLPTYFLHLPTMFFITMPLIKGAAFVYVGLTFSAALLRTILILLVGRLILPVRRSTAATVALPRELTMSQAMRKTWHRFLRRMKKIVIFTVPIYIVIFIINKSGGFAAVEQFMATRVPWLDWLNPQSLIIIVLHIAAEFTAGLAVAGALLEGGTLSEREVIIALLVGNVLSSPVRALRHQLPYYAGIYSPLVALQLILYNQSFRLGSILLMTFLYYWYPVV